MGMQFELFSLPLGLLIMFIDCHNHLEGAWLRYRHKLESIAGTFYVVR